MKLESSSYNSLNAAMERNNQCIIKSFSFYLTDWHEGEKMMKPLLFLGELFLLTVQQKETLIHSHNINQEAKKIKSNSLFFFALYFKLC